GALSRQHIRMLAVDFAHKLNARGKEPLGKRLGASAIGHVGMLVEELEISAPIKNIEKLLMPAGSEQMGTEACTAADHLPELGLRPHRLEEHEVHDLRHVDAGIQ